MDKFFEVMEGPIGRVLRVVLGLVLIYFGLARLSGLGSRILAVAGVLPTQTVSATGNPNLAKLAEKVKEKLARAISRLE